MKRRTEMFFRRLWRRARGLCVMCGLYPNAKPKADDFHSQGGFCRACNKGLHFAQHYGAGTRKLRDMLEQPTHSNFKLRSWLDCLIEGHAWSDWWYVIYGEIENRICARCGLGQVRRWTRGGKEKQS